MDEIVSVDWLNEHIGDENLLVLDASLKKITDDGLGVLEEKTIPNSLFFDLKNHFSDTESDFPNTIPSIHQFEIECRKLGINKSTKIVVFDNLGIYSSPRVWWLFNAIGHTNISVLDGGLPEWKKQDFDFVKRLNRSIEKGDFTANFNSDFVFTYSQILKNIQKKEYTIVDARSSGRFDGSTPEPRKHLQSGHIPQSINIPFEDVLDDGKFKSKEELLKLFSEKIDSNTKLVFSCGSGLTASIIMLANRITGKNNTTIFDGSWTEFAERQELFI